MVEIIHRCNVGNIVGTGHLMEILTLRRAIAERFAVRNILVINRHPSYTERIEDAGFDEIVYLEEDEFNDHDAEFDILEDLGRSHGEAGIILDLFDRPPEYYARIHRLFGRDIVILDSQKTEKLDANIVINFSIFQDREDYAGETGTRYFIGPDYFLMDPLIQNWPGIEVRKNVRRIFFNQGGSDPYNLTTRLLSFLADESDRWKSFRFEIVVGGALKEDHMRDLNALRNDLPGNFVFHYNLPIQDMYDLMSRCDLALTAAGNTLYELCRFGIPSIVIGHHERHRRVGEVFEKKDCALHLGIGTELGKERFLSALRGLIEDYGKRKSLSSTARRTIDGKGLDRVIGIMAEEFSLS